ncbi:hypothetical protein H6G13_03640 [Pseudanabaena sp. FACHB-2040]|nr:hypothetical protein [Pseudanabaena sp. FACHB-2040]
MALLACGGHINSGYFELLELQVSELIYHLEVVQAVQTRIHKDKEKPQWGEDLEWE